MLTVMMHADQVRASDAVITPTVLGMMDARRGFYTRGRLDKVKKSKLNSTGSTTIVLSLRETAYLTC